MPADEPLQVLRHPELPGGSPAIVIPTSIQIEMAMHKPTQDYTYAGCDISKETLDVVRLTNDGHTAHRRFDNTTAGHNQLIQWLAKATHPVRVVVEATGIYSLDLALALHENDHLEVMVAKCAQGLPPLSHAAFEDRQGRCHHYL